MTPKEYLSIHVLQKNQTEYERYIKYLKDPEGLDYTAKHELGLLIAKIRNVHDTTGRKDWYQIAVEQSDEFMKDCITHAKFNACEDCEFDEDTRRDIDSLLLSFGGFDMPDEELCLLFLRLYRFVQNEAKKIEIKQCDPIVQALWKDVMFQKKRFRKKISIFTEAQIPFDVDNVMLEEQQQSADETVWDHYAIPILRESLERARFPKCGLIDFQKYFTTFLTISNTKAVQKQKNAHKIRIESSGYFGNPYASKQKNWNRNVVISSISTCKSEKLEHYPSVIHERAQRLQFLFEGDDKYYEEIIRPRAKEQKLHSQNTLPIQQLAFGPRISSFTIEELRQLENIVSNTINTLEQIQKMPWGIPKSAKFIGEDSNGGSEKNTESSVIAINHDCLKELIDLGTMIILSKEQEKLVK